MENPEATAADEGPSPSDRMTDESRFLKLRDWVTADLEHSNDWRVETRKDFAFVAGTGQWDPVDVQSLRNQKRPVVTFNRTLKFIRAINGLEVNNRHETIFLPNDYTNAGQVKGNELLTGASEWMSRDAGAPRKQSRAFRDATICGMGFVESTISYDDDPRGKYVENRIHPVEMGWDRSARDQNLSDAKRIFRVRKMLLSEARELHPGFSDADLDASWASTIEGATSGTQPRTLQEKQLREQRLNGDDPKREVHIVQIQWYEYEHYRLVLDPTTGQTVEMPEKRYNDMAEAAKQAGQELPATNKPLRRRKFYQAFVGNTILEYGPAPRADGFTLHAMTYEPDDEAGTWFGVVRVLRDPQTWANKFFSQLMHIMNATAKGGIIAETDAFPDIREAQDTYSAVDAITFVKPGAIGANKIMAKPGQGLTTGVLQLFQIADKGFLDTLGVNLELMGLADREQAGVLEAQRKQAAMTILATLFDSLQMFRQEIGKTRLYYIQNYLASDTPRMIRIAGKDGEQAVPLIKAGVMGSYEVIVEDAPQSPHSKERVWASLQPILVALRDMITPEVAVTLLDYVPGIPSKLVDSLKSIAMRPNPDADQQKQLAITKAVEEIRAQKAKTDAAHAGAVLDLAKASGEFIGAQAMQAEQAMLNAIDITPMPDGQVMGPTPHPAMPQPPLQLGPMPQQTPAMPQPIEQAMPPQMSP